MPRRRYSPDPMPQDSSRAASSRAKFDAYADDYVTVHQANISVTGEQPEYFAKYKLHCIERLVGSGFDSPVLDFGCGVGMVTKSSAPDSPWCMGWIPPLKALRPRENARRRRSCMRNPRMYQTGISDW